MDNFAFNDVIGVFFRIPIFFFISMNSNNLDIFKENRKLVFPICFHLSEDLDNVVIENHVIKPFLLYDVENRDKICMGHNHKSFNEAKRLENLAMILYFHKEIRPHFYVRVNFWTIEINTTFKSHFDSSDFCFLFLISGLNRISHLEEYRIKSQLSIINKCYV